MHLFSLKNVSYSYGHSSVLTDISLEIEKGELTVIAGENGIGKTTLLQILAGLIQPTDGKISTHHDGCVAYVAQWFSHEMPLPISVWEFVKSQQSKHKHSHGACSYTTLEDCLNHVWLLSQKNTPIDELSWGQKQRVLIARALMMDPAVLLLDEPTTGIDVHMQDQFYELIEHFNRVHGLSTVMITHDAERQYTFGDHIIYLSRKIDTASEKLLRDKFQQKKVTLIQIL